MEASCLQAKKDYRFSVDENEAGTRLDVFLADKLESCSRSYLKSLLVENNVTVNMSSVTKPAMLLKKGDNVSISIPRPERFDCPPEIDVADIESVGAEIVHEDPDFLVIFKPAGLLVHRPKPRSLAITLVEWLLSRYKEIWNVGDSLRPGIVHRLDKDTSGLLITARNNVAHAIISEQFRKRAVDKRYFAVVQGHPPKTGEFDFRIGRDKIRHTCMAHDMSGREALTRYEVIEYFDDCTLVEAKPVTGRTHQIRVHFASAGYPLVGDPVYGRSSKLIKRHALHAHFISFTYCGKCYSFSHPPPPDFVSLLESLSKNKDASEKLWPWSGEEKSS